MKRFMNSTAQPLVIEARVEPWSMEVPLHISGYTFDALQLLIVTISDGVSTGRGEAAGVYYRSDTPKKMLGQIDAIKGAMNNGFSHAALLEMLPPGGARNAIDCALWELESLQRKIPVWRLAGLPKPAPLTTMMTIGAAEPDVMANEASGKYAGASALKLKLLGDGDDGERVRSVRAARPDVWLAVDANQAFRPQSLGKALSYFIDADVALIEQPFKIGEDDLLDGLECPIAIAADESAQSIDDLEGLVGRVQTINMKLDKCGGLTAAILMAKRARELGLKIMVGAMPGTSLAIAPAFLLGQLCDIVDLDAPTFLSRDRPNCATFANGKITVSGSFWGHAG